MCLFIIIEHVINKALLSFEESVVTSKNVLDENILVHSVQHVKHMLLYMTFVIKESCSTRLFLLALYSMIIPGGAELGIVPRSAMYMEIP